MKKLFAEKMALVTCFTLIALILESQFVSAQVKVGDKPETINAGSVLEIESTNKGLLLPRVSLEDTNVWGLEGTPAAGMQVFNTNATITAGGVYPVALGGIAVYNWDGAGWVHAKALNDDFDWLRSSDDGQPLSPADIVAPIYHGGGGKQEVMVHTTDIGANNFAQMTVRAGHGTDTPINSNFFAETHAVYGRTAGLQMTTRDPLVFRTLGFAIGDPIERMRIATNGSIGIGTTKPSGAFALQVNGKGILQTFDDTEGQLRKAVEIANGGIVIENEVVEPSLTLSSDVSRQITGRVSFSGIIGQRVA